MPPDAGSICAQGTIVLRVEFHADGAIGEVNLIRRMPRGLSESALKAAKKIRFQPAVKDGVAITVHRPVNYVYGWEYGGWKRDQTKFKTTATDNVVDSQADAIIQKAVQNLGGERYLKVYSQIGKGYFSILKGGVNISHQSFIDVIVFPDKERTEFRSAGVKSVQTNTGSTGWLFDGDQELIKVQTEKQVANFKRGIRTSLDNLLRGYWKGDGELTYVGRRPGTLGKRNDVVKLTYTDGFAVEFEFTVDEGTPVKAIYTITNAEGEEIKEEDRYAQFVETQGIKAPYIVDRFTNGAHASRINFETIEYNKPIPDSIFTKPSDPKSLKKDLKL